MKVGPFAFFRLLVADNFRYLIVQGGRVIRMLFENEIGIHTADIKHVCGRGIPRPPKVPRVFVTASQRGFVCAPGRSCPISTWATSVTRAGYEGQ